MEIDDNSRHEPTAPGRNGDSENYLARKDGGVPLQAVPIESVGSVKYAVIGRKALVIYRRDVVASGEKIRVACVRIKYEDAARVTTAMIS